MFENRKNIASKVILVTWLVFSILYVLKGEYNRLQNVVAKTAFERGVSTAATQIIEQSKACKPLPISAGEARVELINVECLQTSEKDVPADPGA